MVKRVWLAAAAVAVLASGAWAQTEPTYEAERRAQEPARKIRVLENPYDIASFYRSSEPSGPGYFAYQSPYDFSDRYPVAGYYRQRQPRGVGFGPYWGAARRRPRLIVGLRHSLGPNTDLFLVAPTFLAPVGPLNWAFFGR